MSLHAGEFDASETKTTCERGYHGIIFNSNLRRLGVWDERLFFVDKAPLTYDSTLDATVRL